ncbi:MAG TPA: ATP-dependent zinc metalloprotease FtsH [Candidatus Eisenbacteria bacterium]|nr:ATP-dependent zinc metalloprotease FtsH [Candidatus Eisenbacteria bacterium]
MVPVGGPARPMRTLALWLFILLVAVIGAQMYFQQRTTPVDISYTRFVQEIDNGNIKSLQITDNQVSGELKRPASVRVADHDVPFTRFHTFIIGSGENLPTQVWAKNPGVEIVSKPPATNWWAVFGTWVLPLILIVALWLFIFRQMQTGGSAALKFGRSRAKVQLESSPKVTFKDVAGCEEAKQELQEIIEFLKDPQKFVRLGGRIPKGALLLGPPGTGKTLLAKAVAGEAGVPFFSMSGSDFVEMFVGVGASRVRDLFDQGKRHAPCILFIDEIDAVGRHRGAGLGGGHDEREQTLNQLLVEMDGFDSNEGVILIAATNRPDVLDPALLRPGRFDRHIVVDWPDLRGREGILRVHTRRIPLSDDVNLEVIARGTPGMAGADLANLVNEAALLAARRNRKKVTMEDFEDAKDKVMLGTERRSLVLTEEEKRRTAYHEGGHALVAWLLPGSDPVHKVTIVPRGRALGLTASLPSEERFVRSKAECERRLVGMLGGRAADKLVFNELTTGAASDIEQATNLAHKMVCEWGMSEALGPLTLGKKDEMVFLGRELATHQNYSEQTSQLIDKEVRHLVEGAYEKALQLLTESRDKLELLARTLLEREVLDGDEMDRLLRGETLPPLGEKGGGTPLKVTEPEKQEKQTAAQTMRPLGGEAAAPA